MKKFNARRKIVGGVRAVQVIGILNKGLLSTLRAKTQAAEGGERQDTIKQADDAKPAEASAPSHVQVVDPRSKEVLDANQRLLDAIEKRDYATYV